MTLFHLIKRRQRRKQSAIAEEEEKDHGMKMSVRIIVCVFSEYMRNKYSPVQVEEKCVRTMVEAVRGRLSDGWRETLQMPITDEQLKAAVFKGDSKL